MNALELAVVNYMPPEFVPALRKAISLKASLDLQADRMRASKRTLGKQRRADLMAAARRVIEHRLIALTGMARMNRADFVQKRLEKFPDKYGLPASYKPTTKDIRLIRYVLREWEKQLASTWQDRAN